MLNLRKKYFDVLSLNKHEADHLLHMIDRATKKSDFETVVRSMKRIGAQLIDDAERLEKKLKEKDAS